MAPRNNRRQNQAKPLTDVDNNPVLRAFRDYAAELDGKHDRYERIVKLSRDITIESKRIIFLLHSIDSRKQNKQKVLEEAQQRLTKLIKTNFCGVAQELKGHDIYQYRWAYSAGLQEFIEAYTFMEYLRGEDDKQNTTVVSNWLDLQQIMQYEDPSTVEEAIEASEEENDEEAVASADEAQETTQDIYPVTRKAKKTDDKKLQFIVEPTEYILGLSDLTGELMRRCINSLGSGETDTCVETCKVLQNFYTGYISLNCPRARELWRKVTTMRQSVLKAENVCYNVKVRGGEAAKWGAVFEQKQDDADEGFY